MLTELRIADLGVIAEAVIEPGPGFTVVTGETGAGKTMVVSGLGLLLGARADARLVRTDASRALVEGRFSVVGEDGDRIAQVGGSLDGGELLVSRQVTPSRSRAFLGGAQVPAAILTDWVAEWLTIHGQAEQIRLGTPERQREVLDRFGGPGLAAVLDGYRSGYEERRELRAELADLVGWQQERARELDLLTFGLEEIAQVDPQPGEDAELATEATRLQAVDDLRAAARTALVSLAGDDEAFDDAPTTLSTAALARKALDGVAERDPALAPLAERLVEAGHLVNDVAADLASYLAGLDADPLRLEWIAARRAQLQQLTRKYGATVDEVLAWSRQAAQRAADLGAGEGREAELRQAITALDARVAESAEQLGGLRRAAAKRLSGLVEAELAALALPRARLFFEIEPAEQGPHGADSITLMFGANPGAAPGPLAKVASGGELSRVRLALEVVLADDAEGQTFVFDEVDAGIGGAVALEVGRRLARLAAHAQVISVTHLAQVAAYADRHFVVEKSDDGSVTTSGIRRVTGDERVAELARMMGGLESMESARAHAADLLDSARSG